MDSRTAAHVLSQIAGFLELRGESRFKAGAYQKAARALIASPADDLGPALRSGALAKLPGIGPATLGVLRDLVQTGESSYLEQLRADTPEGLLEMLRVPGLGTAKIHLIHETLGVQSIAELEEAAHDGRLASLPRFGEKTAEKILKGITFMRSSGALMLLPQALGEARSLLDAVRAHPGVVRADVAGSVRRHLEVILDIDIVAASAEPQRVAASVAHAPGVRQVVGGGDTTIAVRYADGTQLHLFCVPAERYGAALFRATGSQQHVQLVSARLAAKGLTLDGDMLLDRDGHGIEVADEETLYRHAGLAWIPPEVREATDEVEAAASNGLPALLEAADLQGVLHCHSDFSDGKATIEEMARAAMARGWSYIGISDHSQSAFYAGGLKPDALRRQHEEIDRVNGALAGDNFRVLKGIEADILEDGRVDYGAPLLDSFDYVIGSVHSRFSMDERRMTQRILAALDDPHLTILGHPTGRLLLTREPYPVDMDAVLGKAAANGVAVELNADPHRLDIDWRLLQQARALGVTIEIGPDAHSVRGLEYTDLGVGMARKGWIERGDVLNARSADEVLAFARARRS